MIRKCEIEGCEAEITFAWNPATEKRCPLVPYEDKYAAKVRYCMVVSEEADAVAKGHDCEHGCVRDDEHGEWMLHHMNCKDPGAFARSKK